MQLSLISFFLTVKTPSKFPILLYKILDYKIFFQLNVKWKSDFKY